MYSRLHNQFGTAGLILSIAALVFALAGGAYAANHSATASKAGKPGPRGKTGKTGTAGPQGAPGAVGPAGPAGAAGKAGKEGPEGKQGSPWTAGGTLPSGQTETGAWALPESNIKEGNPSVGIASISFPIPLSSPSEPGKAAQAEFITAETTTANCLGSYGHPTARPGHLCIYEAPFAYQLHLCAKFVVFRNLEEPAELNFASSFGTFAVFEPEATPNCEGPAGVRNGMRDGGSWAVTAG